MQKIVDVHIGEIHVGKKGEILRAILGSCLGIGLIWQDKQICALAHCLLPQAPQRTFAIGGRFVDQAVQSMIVLMKIKEGDFSQIRVVIAGGGNMTHPSAKDESYLIGKNNELSARSTLARWGLNIEHAECGGDSGRRIILNSKDFSYQIELIPKLS